MRGLVLAILAVAIATIALVWGSLHLIHDAEKMQRDPRLLRRRFIRVSLIYICGSAWGIVQVIRGNLPPAALIGVAFAASFAWLLIKQASSVKSGQ